MISRWTPTAWELSRQLAISLGQIRDDDSPRVVHIASRKEKTEMPIVEAGGEAPVIEDGLYDLKIISAVPGVREGVDQYGNVDQPILTVNMAVGGTEDDDGNEIVLRTVMNLKWSQGGKYPPSTLYLYAVAFCRVADAPFDTDWLVGKSAQGMIRTEEEGKWPKVVNESLLPARKTPAQKAPVLSAAARSVAPDDIPFGPPWEALESEADANALESFYEAGDQYARRSEIKSTSQRMFNDRLPEALTTQEREELLAELKRGAS